MARGRPRIKIDYRQVEQLAAMQCTDEEIAAVLGVERSTIKRRKKDDDEFCTAYKKGKERGKAFSAPHAVQGRRGRQRHDADMAGQAVSRPE